MIEILNTFSRNSKKSAHFGQVWSPSRRRWTKRPFGGNFKCKSRRGHHSLREVWLLRRSHYHCWYGDHSLVSIWRLFKWFRGNSKANFLRKFLEAFFSMKGIGVEMERLAAKMGGTIKWPYNESECLDADFFKVNVLYNILLNANPYKRISRLLIFRLLRITLSKKVAWGPFCIVSP